MIWLKAATSEAGYKSTMASAFPPALIPVPVAPSAKAAQRLLANAKLCREIAALSWNEADARKLEEIAAECMRWAGAAGETASSGPLH